MEGARPFRAVSEQHGRENAGILESLKRAYPFGDISEQHGREKTGPEAMAEGGPAWLHSHMPTNKPVLQEL